MVHQLPQLNVTERSNQPGPVRKEIPTRGVSAHPTCFRAQCVHKADITIASKPQTVYHEHCSATLSCKLRGQSACVSSDGPSTTMLDKGPDGYWFCWWFVSVEREFSFPLSLSGCAFSDRGLQSSDASIRFPVSSVQAEKAPVNRRTEVLNHKRCDFYVLLLNNVPFKKFRVKKKGQFDKIASRIWGESAHSDNQPQVVAGGSGQLLCFSPSPASVYKELEITSPRRKITHFGNSHHGPFCNNLEFTSEPDLPPHLDRPALPPLTSLGFRITTDAAHPSPVYPPKLLHFRPTTQHRSCAQHHRHVWWCIFSFLQNKTFIFFLPTSPSVILHVLGQETLHSCDKLTSHQSLQCQTPQWEKIRKTKH
nr:uncharacterized protein LOC129156198 [Nothobranchius furzeri]